MIEEDLLLVILVHPATPDLHHHATDLALAVVTIIPLLLNAGIQDLCHLRREGTVENDRTHHVAGRGHTHALHPIMEAQEAAVVVQLKSQSTAEAQVRSTVMLGSQPALGPLVSEN